MHKPESSRIRLYASVLRLLTRQVRIGSQNRTESSASDGEKHHEGGVSDLCLATLECDEDQRPGNNFQEAEKDRPRDQTTRRHHMHPLSTVVMACLTLKDHTLQHKTK